MQSPAVESLELARFRQKWLDEVQGRRAALISSPNGPLKSVVSPLPPPPSAQIIQSVPSTVAISLPSTPRPSNPLPGSLGSAVNIYRQAVEHEQRSDLDNALILYRQAFRMDPHVDRVFQRQEMLASILTEQQDPFHKTKASIITDTLVDDLTIRLQQSLLLRSSADYSTSITVTSTLATILLGFPSRLSFEPEMEDQPIHIHKLPDELLVMILRKLDPTSIERFAVVNRKSRLLALDPSIWRDFVRAIYKPPQVLDIESMVSVAERCLSDYRRVFIEHPRVRLDGVYIATCHYVRPGLSENSWVNISHLIIYHRYLRFFPNGRVLSLLANEEHTPQQVIPILKPTLRMKASNWNLSGTAIHLSNLLDASGRFPLPSFPSNFSAHEELDIAEGPRYTFTMSLELLSRPLGRWNKLRIKSYNSVHLETGDINPVALKHERPFWFSKVQSYALF